MSYRKALGQAERNQYFLSEKPHKGLKIIRKQIASNIVFPHWLYYPERRNDVYARIVEEGFVASAENRGKWLVVCGLPIEVPLRTITRKHFTHYSILSTFSYRRLNL